jgi:hypothetical protein
MTHENESKITIDPNYTNEDRGPGRSSKDPWSFAP